MGIGKNIAFHRDRLDWTLEQLSQASGVDVGTINALENRDSSRSKFFGAIAEGLGMSIDDLHKDPSKWVNSHTDTHGKPFVKQEPQRNYPRVVGTARMGDQGYYLDLDGGDGYVEFEAEPGAIAIQVRGDSMFPAIRDGWYIIIEPSAQPAMGEYVLLKFKNGKNMVKELIQVKSDCYVVMSVNGEERITAMKEDLHDIKGITAVVPPSKHKS